MKIENVYFHLTKACNLRCSYCYFSAARPLPNEMSAAEIEKIWPQFVALRPEKIIFTGGEPLLRRDLFEILRSLRRADPLHLVERCLNTNGWTITPKVAARLRGLVDEVRVSLDAPAVNNDKLRGSGSFSAAIAALDLLRGEGFQPKVLVTVTRLTLHDLPALIAHLAGQGITRIHLNQLRPIGRAARQNSLRVEAREVREVLGGVWPGSEIVRTRPETACCERVHCGVGRFLNISPTGDVYPCHVLERKEFRLGNLRQTPLREICRPDSLVGRLAALDFSRLADAEPRVTPLLAPDACLGEVYAKSASLSVWDESLVSLSTT